LTNLKAYITKLAKTVQPKSDLSAKRHIRGAQ